MIYNIHFGKTFENTVTVECVEVDRLLYCFQTSVVGMKFMHDFQSNPYLFSVWKEQICLVCSIIFVS